MTKEKAYKYSEIFGNTIQGEGRYTGIPTVWIRFWGCNFTCDGFGQDNPADPSTWNLDYQAIDVSTITRMEDLPVFNRGCDSSYSWSKKYAHLAPTGTVGEICDKLEAFLKSPSNPEGKFLHPKSGQWTHMAFTGGEPMMNQNAIADIMDEFRRRGNEPRFVTVETNGTQAPRMKFVEMIERFNGDSIDTEWFWSVSPKLYLSGEQKEDALKPEIVKVYRELSHAGQLKYVCDGSERAWQEVEEFTDAFRAVGIDWPVYIMPVSATRDGQEKIQAHIAEECTKRGYNLAARLHCWVFSNVIGK